jgi:hypothetical protein
MSYYFLRLISFCSMLVPAKVKVEAADILIVINPDRLSEASIN